MRLRRALFASAFLLTAALPGFAVPQAAAATAPAVPQSTPAPAAPAAAATDPAAPQGTPAPAAPVQERVMVIGGSMAHGWKDPHDDSYIKRAFATLSALSGVQYTCLDRTITGGSPSQWAAKQPGQFAQWLAKDKPQVVVISWGLLNDLSAKTPLADFTKAVAAEIQTALAAHAVVLVVSPPVVRASLTKYGPAETRMIAGEFQAAASFHSRNVFMFDLYQQMANYLQKHHQSIDVYAGDNWHPNSTGHALAGNLLFNDLVQAFGTSPITFQAAPAGGRTAAAVPASIRSAPNQGKTGGR